MSYYLYLFGSHARGDSDLESDIDVLKISKNINNIENSKIDSYLYSKYRKKVSISSYEKSHILEYYKNGHLFAWHLYNEAKYLVGSNNRNILKEFGPPSTYQNYNDDLNDFVLLIDGIYKNIKRQNLGFETCNLYTAIRNISFFYVLKNFSIMDFSPYALYKRQIDFPISCENYKIYKNIKASRTIGSTHIENIEYENVYRDICSLKQWVEETGRNGKL